MLWNDHILLLPQEGNIFLELDFLKTKFKHFFFSL